MTIEGAGFVDKEVSNYEITIQGPGCDLNQTYISGSDNVTVYVDESSTSGYLILENANFSGCTGNVFASVVYSSQTSTDMVQIGTAVYLSDTLSSKVILLSDSLSTRVTLEGSGFVDSDPSNYAITLSCGNVSLGDMTASDNCIPYNTVTDENSGRSTTTLIATIASSVDAASECSSGDVIYGSVTYAGQSSETVTLGYVLGLEDTSTSIPILGDSSETITLSGVGFNFDVSNSDTDWNGVDINTLTVILSSDTCSDVTTTLSNVDSSTTLITATADFSGCSGTVSASVEHEMIYADECDDVMNGYLPGTISSTQDIGSVLSLQDTSTSQGVKAGDSSYVVTLQGSGFVGSVSDYALILSGCETGTHNIDSILSDASVTVTIDLSSCLVEGTVVNGSLSHVLTGVQTESVGIATVGLFVMYETTLTLPAADSSINTYEITLSGSGFYDTDATAYVACLSGESCECTCADSSTVCDGTSQISTSRVNNNNLVISDVNLTSCTGSVNATLFYEGSLNSANTETSNSIGTILLLSETLTSQSLIQKSSSTLTVTGSGFIYTNTSAYSVSTYCNESTSSSGTLVTTTSVSSDTEILLSGDLSGCSNQVYVVLNYDDGELNFTFPVDSDSTGIGTIVQITDTTTTQALVQQNMTVTINGQGFFETNSQTWEATFSGEGCTSIDASLSTADSTLSVTNEYQLLASIDLSGCYGAISVTLATNNTGTSQNAPVSAVSIGKMIEILSNDLFVNETQALGASSDFEITVFGTGFGSSTLDEYNVTIFGTDCDSAGSSVTLSSVSYDDSYVRLNANTTSTASDGADAMLVGTANLSGCSETVYASIDFQGSGLPGLNVSVGEIVRVSDTETVRGYFVSNSIKVVIDGVGFVSEDSSDYIFEVIESSTNTSITLNSSNVDSFSREEDSSSSKKATLTYTGIDVSDFSVATCVYSTSTNTCADQVLTARVSYKDFGWSESEVSIGRLVFLAETEAAVEAASDQTITFRGSGFGSELPSVDSIRAIVLCSEEGVSASCLSTTESENLDSLSTCSDGSTSCDADPGTWFLNSAITSIDSTSSFATMGNIDFELCLDAPSSTGVHVQLIADTNDDGNYVYIDAACVSIGSMLTVYDTSTTQGAANAASQTITISGTGFGDDSEVAEKKNLIKVSGTNCPDTSLNSSFLEISYVKSTELSFTTDLTGCTNDVVVSIYQRQEDFETNISAIESVSDYVASLVDVENSTGIPSDVALIVDSVVVATIVQISETYVVVARLIFTRLVFFEIE